MTAALGKTVAIELFAENTPDLRNDYAVVAIDVIRATTTAITGVALGRRCFTAPTVDAAFSLAARMRDPLLVGEVGGVMPLGFELQNSPMLLEGRADIERPMILLSTSGTRLIDKYKQRDAVYLACLRNLDATTHHLTANHPKVVLIGAGSRGEFREEDQLCCAWIAEKLIGVGGYLPENGITAEIVERWRGAPLDRICDGNSAAYLRRSGQEGDLHFILTHVNDLNAVYRVEEGQVVEHPMMLNIHPLRRAEDRLHQTYDGVSPFF